jgi:hypothetical protein
LNVSKNTRIGIDRRRLMLGAAATFLPRPAATAPSRQAPPPFRNRLAAPASVRVGRAKTVALEPLVWSPVATERNPPGTLAEAFDRPESTVALAPGIYEPALLERATKRLIAPSGGVIIRARGPNLAGQRFERDDMGLWHTRLLLRHSKTIIRLLHPTVGADGRERRLRRHRITNPLWAGEQGWHLDQPSGDLTIRSDVAPETLRAIYSDAGGTSDMTVSGGSLTLKGDFTFDGVALYARPAAGLAASLALRGTSIQFTDGPGVRIEDSDFHAEGVRVYASTADCFSYVGRGLGIEINCRASHAGDLDHATPWAENCNASSAHGEYTIARFGGIYERSYGPDIADAGDGKKIGYSWNVGVIAQGSLAGVGIGVYDKRMAWLDTCQGNLWVEKAEVRAFDCRFASAILRKGTVEAYDPANP